MTTNKKNTSITWVSWGGKKNVTDNDKSNDYIGAHSLTISNPEEFEKKLEKFVRNMDED